MSHRPRKRFGQNFLHDQNVLDHIIAAADFQEDDRILEIGPGPGALTSRLLATGLPVLAVEIDRDLGTALQARDEKNLDVRIGDVLRLDWMELLQNPPYKLIANLPYNISSQVLFKVLDHRHAFRRLVLLFQKEVGDRLTSDCKQQPGASEDSYAQNSGFSVIFCLLEACNQFLRHFWEQ